MRCLESVFLLTYSRLRSSPSSWICASFLGGKLRERTEDDAAMPFGVRDVPLVLLVGGLGRHIQGGKAATLAGANFSIVAQEADEGYFVLVHDSVSVF
jgi:hypothetical protein